MHVFVHANLPIKRREMRRAPNNRDGSSFCVMFLNTLSRVQSSKTRWFNQVGFPLSVYLPLGIAVLRTNVGDSEEKNARLTKEIEL